MIQLGKVLKSDSHDNWFKKNSLIKQMELEGSGVEAAGKDWEYMLGHLSQMAKISGNGYRRKWGTQSGGWEREVSASGGENLSYEQIIKEICRITEVSRFELGVRPYMVLSRDQIIHSEIARRAQ